MVAIGCPISLKGYCAVQLSWGWLLKRNEKTIGWRTRYHNDKEQTWNGCEIEKWIHAKEIIRKEVGNIRTKKALEV